MNPYSSFLQCTDVLTEVFRFFPLKQRILHFSLVCKDWNTYCYALLKHLTIDYSMRHSFSYLLSLAPKSLEHLSITYLAEDKMLAEIEKFQNLKSLRISQCRLLTEKAVVSMLDKLGKLEKLALLRLPFSMVSCITQYGKLKELDLSFCVLKEGDKIDEMQLPRNLKKLKMCYSNDKCLTVISKCFGKLEQLEELDFSNSSGIRLWDHVLKNIALLPKLKKLSLCSCKLIFSSHKLVEVLDSCKELRDLDIKFAIIPGINECLKHMNHLEKLNALHVDTDANLKKWVYLKKSNLKELRVEHSSEVSELMKIRPDIKIYQL